MEKFTTPSGRRERCTNIPHKNDIPKITNSLIYAERMPPDFSAMLMKDYMYIEKGYKEKLMRIPEFSEWLRKRGSLLNGSI